MVMTLEGINSGLDEVLKAIFYTGGMSAIEKLDTTARRSSESEMDNLFARAEGFMRVLDLDRAAARARLESLDLSSPPDWAAIHRLLTTP